MLRLHPHLARLLLAGSLAFCLPLVVRAANDTDALADAAHDVLKSQCFDCHGKTVKVKGDVRVLDHAFLVGSTRKIVVPGDPAASEMIRQIEAGKMPPKSRPRLADADKKVLHDWIAAGAPAFKAEGVASAATETARPAAALQEFPSDLPPEIGAPRTPSAAPATSVVPGPLSPKLSGTAVTAVGSAPKIPAVAATGGPALAGPGPVGPALAGPAPAGPALVGPPAGGALTFDSPLGAQVKAILNQNCFKCHGGKKVSGDVKILDLDLLVKGNYLTPGNPAKSTLFQLVSATKGDMMPPEELPRLKADEVAIIGQWISGQPAVGGVVEIKHEEPKVYVGKLGVEYVLRSIYQDVHRLTQEQRRHVRYFSFTHILDGGCTSEALEMQREALYKAINHMTWSPVLVTPTAIESTRTVYRIDLRQLGWEKQVYSNTTGDYKDMSLFDLALLEYPYGVIYDRSDAYQGLVREYFPYCKQVRPVAFVRSDWFCSIATQPPLYHDFLQMPKTLSELEYGLGVHDQEDIDYYRVQRAGFVRSGVSNNNRVIERHTAKYGFFWKSYDFKSSQAQENMFKDPINLHPTGGEMIFTLPNGLQGYYLVNNKGNRLDAGPTEIVIDSFAANKEVRNGLSCIRCHKNGQQTGTDVVRPTLKVTAGNPGFLVSRALKLYPEQSVINNLFKTDTDNFLGVMKRLIPKPIVSEPLVPVSHQFIDELLNLDQSSAELGLATPAGLKSIFALPQFSSLGLATLVGGGEIRRDSWEDYYDRVIRQLGQGVPVVSLDAITRPDYSPSSPGPFKLTVKTNKPNNLFDKKEELVISVKADQDVYIEIISTGTAGTKTILVPSSTKIKAGKEFRYPAADSPNKIYLKPGKEQFTVFASTGSFPGGQVMRADGIDDRVFHPFYISRKATQTEIRFSPDPMKTIKKTIQVETR